MATSSGARRPRRAKTQGLDPVTAYATAVVEGRVVAGRWVKLQCQRHLDLLKTARERGVWFDATIAQTYIDFFGYLPQRKGKYAKQPLTLQPWQQFAVGYMFGWRTRDEHGDEVRMVREVYWEMGRGNGKTTTLAGILNALFALDREPGAEVYVAATKLQQANQTFTESKWQLEHTIMPLAKRVRILVENMSIAATGAKYEALGADRDSGDSLNTHGLGLDELHEYRARDYIEKLETSLGKRRQPLLVCTTTAGGAHSAIWREKREYAMNVLNGVFEDLSLLPLIYCIDDPEKWDDEAEWPKANPNLGISVPVEYLRQACRKAQRQPLLRSQFLRYHCGVPATDTESWLSLEEWHLQASEPHGDDREALKEALDGRTCTAALVASSPEEMAAFVLWFPDEEGDGGEVLAWWWAPETTAERREDTGTPYGHWEREGRLTLHDGPTLDYDAIRDEILVIAERFEVQSIAVSPYQAVQITKQLEAAGLTVAKTPHTMPRLGAPTMEVERLVLLHQFRHHGDPILLWQASNTVARKDKDGRRMPSIEKSSDIIPGVMAMVMAVGESMTAEEKPSSVYEERDMRFA